MKMACATNQLTVTLAEIDTALLRLTGRKVHLQKALSTALEKKNTGISSENG